MTVRIGTRCAKRAARSYRELLARPTREAEDDGALILHAGHDGDECPATWGDLVALITPEMWAASESDRARTCGMAVVPCAWARRARCQ